MAVRPTVRTDRRAGCRRRRATAGRRRWRVPADPPHGRHRRDRASLAADAHLSPGASVTVRRLRRLDRVPGLRRRRAGRLLSPENREAGSRRLQGQLRRSSARQFHIVLSDQRIAARSRRSCRSRPRAHRRHARRQLRFRSRARPRGAAVPVSEAERKRVAPQVRWRSTRWRRAATRPAASAIRRGAATRRRRPRGLRAAGRAGRARARPLVREKERVAWGELVAIERAGPDRVPPPCPLFGSCGGCQWQHVTIEAQRRAKKTIVERALGRRRSIAGASPPGRPSAIAIARSSTVGPGGALGFHARRSHEIVDVPSCPLLSRRWTRALPAVRAFARGCRPGPRSICRRAPKAFTSTSRSRRQRRRARAPRDRSAARRGRRRAVDRRQAVRRARPRSTSPSAAARRCRSPPAASRRSGAPATPRSVAACWRRSARRRAPCSSSTPARATSRAQLVAQAAPRACHACEGDPAAVARGARACPGRDLECADSGHRRRRRRARPAARGRRRRAPGGGHARAPPDRLRLVRSADAVARRAPHRRRRLSPDARAGDRPDAADVPRRGRRHLRAWRDIVAEP